MHLFNCRAWLILLTACAWCGSAWAEPHVVAGNDPAAAPIQQAAMEFWTKLSKHDLDAVRAVFAGEGEQAELFDAHVRFLEAAEALRKTFAENFKDPQSSPADSIAGVFARRAEGIPAKPLVINGDAASIAASTLLDTGMELRNVDGQWKVTRLTVLPHTTAPLREFLTSEATFWNTTRVKIDAGTLATLEAATREMEDQMRLDFHKWSQSFIPTTRPSSDAVPPTSPTLATGPTLAEIEVCREKPFRSPEIQRLIASFPGLPYFQTFKDTFHITSPQTGISLTFGVRDGLLGSVHLDVAGTQGDAPYRGDLPRGLTRQDRRRDIERKLGRPPTSSGGDSTSYYADYPTLGISVKYARPGARDPANEIGVISLSRPVEGAEPPATQPAPPGPRLTFRLVVKDADPGKTVAEPLPDPQDPSRARTLLVMRDVALDERHVAEVFYAPTGAKDMQMGISFTFTPKGSEWLRTLSRDHIGWRLAIVLDGQVLIAPTMQSEMFDRVIISVPTVAGSPDAAILTGKLHAIVNALPPEPHP